jgi:hypothetical protein
VLHVLRSWPADFAAMRASSDNFMAAFGGRTGTFADATAGRLLVSLLEGAGMTTIAQALAQLYRLVRCDKSGSYLR